MPERFEIYIVYKRRYINTLPFLFPFKSPRNDEDVVTSRKHAESHYVVCLTALLTSMTP